MVNQTDGMFAANDNVAYLAEDIELLQCFNKCELLQIPIEKNKHENALSKMANTRDRELFKTVPIESLPKLSIDQKNGGNLIDTE